MGRRNDALFTTWPFKEHVRTIIVSARKFRKEPRVLLSNRSIKVSYGFVTSERNVGTSGKESRNYVFEEHAWIYEAEAEVSLLFETKLFRGCSRVSISSLTTELPKIGP